MDYEDQYIISVSLVFIVFFQGCLISMVAHCYEYNLHNSVEFRKSAGQFGGYLSTVQCILLYVDVLFLDSTCH